MWGIKRCLPQFPGRVGHYEEKVRLFFFIKVQGPACPLVKSLLALQEPRGLMQCWWCLRIVNKVRGGHRETDLGCCGSAPIPFLDWCGLGVWSSIMPLTGHVSSGELTFLNLSFSHYKKTIGNCTQNSKEAIDFCKLQLILRFILRSKTHRSIEGIFMMKSKGSHAMRTFLVGQWLRLHLETGGHRSDPWSGKMPHATEQRSWHNHWAQVP